MADDNLPIRLPTEHRSVERQRELYENWRQPDVYDPNSLDQQTLPARAEPGFNQPEIVLWAWRAADGTYVVAASQKITDIEISHEYDDEERWTDGMVIMSRPSGPVRVDFHARLRSWAQGMGRTYAEAFAACMELLERERKERW